MLKAWPWVTAGTQALPPHMHVHRRTLISPFCHPHPSWLSLGTSSLSLAASHRTLWSPLLVQQFAKQRTNRSEASSGYGRGHWTVLTPQCGFWLRTPNQLEAYKDQSTSKYSCPSPWTHVRHGSCMGTIPPFTISSLLPDLSQDLPAALPC